MAISVATNNTLGFGFSLDQCIKTGRQNEFCQLINKTDSTPFQVSLNVADSVLFNGFKVKASGTATPAMIGYLEDTGATFRDDGIRRHWFAKNTTDNTYHEVKQVESNTKVDLAIGTIGNGKDYFITDWSFSNATWDETSEIITANNYSTIRRHYGLRTNRYYKVEVTVNTYTAGELTVMLGLTSIGTIDSAGTFTFYGKMDDSAGRILVFIGDGSCNMELSGVNVYSVSTVGLQVKDSDGAIVDENYDGTYVTYYETTAQIDYDWSQLDDGCYTLCVLDITNNDLTPDGQFNFEQNVSIGTNTSIVNINIIDAGADFVEDGVQDGSNAWGAMAALNTSTFNDAVSIIDRTNLTTLETTTQSPIWTGNSYNVSYWFTISGSSTVSIGQLDFSGASTSICVAHTTSVLPLNRYEVIFTVSNYDTAGINVICFDQTLTSEIFISNISADGTYSIIIEPSSISDIFFLGFIYGGQGGGSGLTVTDVQLYEIGDATDCSECVNIGTHDCTLLLTATNDDNAFGLDFTNFSLTQSIRVSGRLANPRYPLEAEVYKFSNGQRRILTGERDKFETLQIREVPEYIHDNISLFLISDTFQIDGVTYVKSDSDYEPTWRRTSLLAPALYDVQKGTQDNENASC